MITNDSPVRCLKFSNNGKYILSTNDKGELIIHDINSTNIINVQKNNDMESESNALWSLDISQDDKVVAVGSENSYIKYFSFNKLLYSSEELGLDEDEDSLKCKSRT